MDSTDLNRTAGKHLLHLGTLSKPSFQHYGVNTRLTELYLCKLTLEHLIHSLHNLQHTLMFIWTTLQASLICANKFGLSIHLIVESVA